MNTQDALVACLPPVAYDPKGLGVLVETGAAAASLDEVIASADVLRLEQQPESALFSLGDWERNYNLPDACVGGSNAAVDVRRSNLLARISGRGNLSRRHMIELAASIGYPGCAISEYSAMTCEDASDSACTEEDFVGVWRLDVPLTTALFEATCESPCDVQLRRWGNTQLECLINRRKPAHTIALFAYDQYATEVSLLYGPGGPGLALHELLHVTMPSSGYF